MDDDGEQIPVIIGSLPHVQTKKNIGDNAPGSGSAASTMDGFLP
jgi:hypothetical protein